MGLYRIAGLTVQMDVAGRIRKQAEPYGCTGSGPADITIDCDPARLLEQNPSLQDLDLARYMGTGAVFARKLLEFGGFQLHASAVVLDGRAYLFSAPGGVGKSTHTEKWCRLFGAEYLNDDKPVLRAMEDGWMAWGTPWSGKHDLSSPRGAKLGGIAWLQRGEENTIERLEPEDAVPLIMSQCLHRLNAAQMDTQLKLLDRLLREVPIWRLTCRNEDGAAVLSWENMTEVAR